MIKSLKIEEIHKLLVLWEESKTTFYYLNNLISINEHINE